MAKHTPSSPPHDEHLAAVLAQWQAAWEPALETWSRFTKLRDPIWCLTPVDEEREGLTGSFAMIRLNDHSVVISLRQVIEQKLETFATEILAHEIGHHVYTPADLRDNARALTRIRHGLLDLTAYAGMVANLYEDLLINDRLQRHQNLDILGVYQALRQEGPVSRVWTFYMHLYEVLWGLADNTLVDSKGIDVMLRTDVTLGAKLIRVYAKDWIAGAGRFAVLIYPYLREDANQKGGVRVPLPFFDTSQAGAGTEMPEGLATIEADEFDGMSHPRNDPNLGGFAISEDEHPTPSDKAETLGGRKNRYRDPTAFLEIMKSLGVKIKPKDLIIKYYRELAVPHLIRFPSRIVSEASDPLPEGLDVWDVGRPLTAVDWVETLIRSPLVVPGLTTVERTFGTTEGGTPKTLPIDLYLGIDCSGSMRNPSASLAYPILAGAIITISALRAGASAWACLSGEMPGQFSETGRFIRDEKELLGTLTGYLGTGYSFGIQRLHDAFIKEIGGPIKRPTHILVITDSDIFYMLKQHKQGWDIAREAVEKAGGGATLLLNMPSDYGYGDSIQTLRSYGWDIYFVTSEDEMIAFARAFAKTKYEVQKAQPGLLES